MANPSSVPCQFVSLPSGNTLVLVARETSLLEAAAEAVVELPQPIVVKKNLREDEKKSSEREVNARSFAVAWEHRHVQRVPPVLGEVSVVYTNTKKSTPGTTTVVLSTQY